MTDPTELYLDLLKRCLLGELYQDGSITGGVQQTHDPSLRNEGRDWPQFAHTMIGRKRLDHLHECLDVIRNENIPGDVIETGVWRGGASIFMRAYMKAYGESRTVWAADSFQGLPKPDAERYPQDAGDQHYAAPELAISLDEVKSNFEHYGLLDDGAQFLQGWFQDTLPSAPIEQLALLRLDGDMYQSTWEALNALYKKVSPGGFIIVDDYGAVPACKTATEDFRKTNNITAEIHTIDWTGAWWRKL
ncbi:TylF/MycF family methyltransferase [bacterium]|nr:TylF/MycF family methyltransferase [bacterium]